MAFYERYGRPGWYQDSQRHSLASRGIKTAARGAGTILGRGLLTSGGLVAEGLCTPPENETVLLSDDDGLGEAIKSEEVMADVENVAGDVFEEKDGEASEEHVVEDVGDDGFSFLPNKEEHDFSEKVSAEVQELHHTMDVSNFREGALGKVKEILSSIQRFYGENNTEELGEATANLEGQKMLFKDKITIINGIRKDVMSKKFREETHLEEQLKAVETVDRSLGLLVSDLNKIDSKLREAKSRTAKLERQDVSGIKPEKRFSIFPKFSEVFGQPPSM